MSKKVSIVIITKNESKHIGACIQSALQVSDDIIIVDSGSTDDTLSLARQNKVHIIETEWKGYGENRNTGAANARHDWIYSLDADERFSDKLVHFLLSFDVARTDCIYKCHRTTFIGSKQIRHGDWKHDAVIRLYNRKRTCWNTAPVHEKIITEGLQIEWAEGELLHFSFDSTDQLFQKADRYVQLNVEKYLHLPEKRKHIITKGIFSPIVAFLKTYIFRLGFLDGKEGLAIARAAAYSSRKKYSLLRKRLQEKN